MLFLAAVRQQQQHALRSEAARQVEQKLQAALVAPMHVLDGDEQRLSGRQAREEAREGLKELVFLLFRFVNRSGQRFRQEGGELREKFDQCSSSWIPRGGYVFRGMRGQKGTQEI